MTPSWNLRQQRQEHKKQGEERNRSSHVDLLETHHHSSQHNISFSQNNMSSFEVTAELTWENGQLAMHELGGIFQPNPTWGRGGDGGGAGGAGDTLESVVHQAAYCNNPIPNLTPATQLQQAGRNMELVGSVVASSEGKWAGNPGPVQTHGPLHPSGSIKKRTRPETVHRGLTNDHESACANQNVALSTENNDTTMMTWSYESPRSSTRTKTTANDEDSACHGGSDNQEEERETKGETGRSYPTRKGRAAAVHNQSERRRRDRINQKMKALQKLVPNSSKTDKASMLDEVIEYLKQLQAQLQMMSHTGFMPQMMMPLGMQQHLQQMSLLARMGMGMGMIESPSIGSTLVPPQQIPSLVHPNQVAGFVPPAFGVPQMIAATQQNNSDAGASSSAHLQDPYNSFLAQSMNLELCNRIAALQRQQQTPSQPTNNRLQQNNHVQRS